MNCLSCARAGEARTAVALCPRCQAGLCLDHVADAASGGGPGGTNLSCGHRTWDAAWQHDRGSGPQESLSAPNRFATS